MTRASGPQTLLQAAFVFISRMVGSSQWNNLDMCPSIPPILDTVRRTERTLEVVVGQVRERPYLQLDTLAHGQIEPQDNVFIEVGPRSRLSSDRYLYITTWTSNRSLLSHCIKRIFVIKTG